MRCEQDFTMELAKSSEQDANPFQYFEAGLSLHDSFTTTLFNNLSDTEVLIFSSTCKTIHRWTAERRKQIRDETSKLLKAVVQGDEDAAKKIIIANPNLLRNPNGIAEDYSGRPIKGLTPFQAALCAGDTQMSEMMQEYMDQQEVVKQFNKIFPEGFDAHLAKQEQNVFNFDKIFAAISSATNEECKKLYENPTDTSGTLGQAIAQFRIEFDAQSKSEQIFNPHHLLKSNSLHTDYYLKKNKPELTGYKIDVVTLLITGFVQRYLPANYAQAYIMGLSKATKQRLERNFTFASGSERIFPLTPLGLGFNWYVSDVLRPTPLRKSEHFVFQWNLKDFIETNNKNLKKIIEPSSRGRVRP